MDGELSKPLTAEVRSRLQEHFQSAPESDAGKQWSKLWDAGDFLPWDRGTSNPALLDTLNDQKDVLGVSPFIQENGKRRRKRALVPGCGRGYDVFLLASHGYDAYGLELAPNAVKAAQELAKDESRRLDPVDKEAGSGKAEFLVADFFSKDWEKGVEGEGTFEIIYDYTFFCAIIPSLRPKWAKRMSELLGENTTSSLICLEFPTYKDPATGGPPFGLPQKVYLGHLSRPGEKLPYDDSTNLLEEKLEKGVAEDGLVPVKRWQPERTHEIGKGTDWVSIWKKQRKALSV